MQHEKVNRSGETSFVAWLRDEYIRRRTKNNHYSLRAFARHLGLRPGPLSEILSEKRGISAKLLSRIVDKLGLTPAQKRLFLEHMAHSQKCRSLLANFGKTRASENSELKILDDDTFFVISDWYHFALLSLVETDDFQHQPAWISKRLKISTVEAQVALERLVRLRLLFKTGERYSLNQKGITTSHDIPSGAIKKAHRQCLNQAIACLDDITPEARDITYITMAIDPSKLMMAKKLISKFRQNMARFLEEGHRTEVYTLSIQLFPLTQLTDQGE